MLIDVTMGTLGRKEQFRKAIRSLNEQNNANDLCLYIMDGNIDNEVGEWIAAGRWKFRLVRIVKERQVLASGDRGLWPKIYNYLMKMGDAPLVTYWSDDIFPDKACMEHGVRGFRDPMVGAVAFAWCDGDKGKYRIYGTELHKQVMVNFGLFRRTVLKKVNFIDDEYKFYNADQDLSLKIWYAGHKVIRCEQGKVVHYSGKKSDNAYRSDKHYGEDSRRFASKWSYKRVKDRSVKI